MIYAILGILGPSWTTWKRPKKQSDTLNEKFRRVFHVCTAHLCKNQALKLFSVLSIEGQKFVVHQKSCWPVICNFRYFKKFLTTWKRLKKQYKVKEIFCRNLDLYNKQLCKNPVLKHFSNFSIERQNVSFVKNFMPRFMRF